VKNIREEVVEAMNIHNNNTMELEKNSKINSQSITIILASTKKQDGGNEIRITPKAEK
jgi:hypothetical protein